ncbi:hypothetical protein SAMN05444422_104182 [Halobiforma haloterrestris]|uniref:Metal-binding protein n=1 Tax=Natronobacterium haloterrestre TaxID=148448 RepID=A0A1I1GGL5_NATHA|nr:UPF0058 family protein [Halobiforma haloterrestris]SFC08493.1 hypothetical protein SAMN05444422_104182 [Halobiforma haloterrestris]
MRRDELINLHALLREIRGAMADRGDVHPEAFAAYDHQRTRPMHVHRAKRDHKRAVRLLLWGIVRSITVETDVPAPRQ